MTVVPILWVRLLSGHPQKRSYHNWNVQNLRMRPSSWNTSRLAQNRVRLQQKPSMSAPYITMNLTIVSTPMIMTLPVMRKIKMGLPGPEEGVALIKRLLKEITPTGNLQRVMRTLMLMTALMLPRPRLSGLPRLEEKVTLLMKGPIQLPVPDSDGRVKRFLLTGRCPRFP